MKAHSIFHKISFKRSKPIPSPYIGPRAFERRDRSRFFGRDQEAAELVALITAHRVVLLYASSGAGKTSLLNALIVPQLEMNNFEVLPLTRVQGAVQAHLNIVPNPYTLSAIMGWVGVEDEQEDLTQLTISDYLILQEPLEDKYGQPAPRVLIFDQFEELFTAYPTRWKERAGFFEQIDATLTAHPLLRIVFSIREDYIAQLDPYAGYLPNHLRHRFRLERMRPPAALSAVTGPLRETKRSYAPGTAEKLVEELRQIRMEVAEGTITDTGEFIEPVQLQVVCQNLWQSLPLNITTITQTDIETYGDVNYALARFYEKVLSETKRKTQVRESELRDWFEKKLITPAGTRGIIFQDQEKGETDGLRNDAVLELDRAHIIRGEIRAGSRWYELTHDRFIEPIQKSNENWRQRQRQNSWRLGLGFIIILLVAVVILWVNARDIIQSQVISTVTSVSATEQAEQAAFFATTSQAMETAIAATDVRSTATAIAATATQAHGNAEAALMATASATAATATSAAEINTRSTANAQATTQAQETAIAIAVTDIARATIDAQATITAQELERLSQPIRPLRPGISIGASNSDSTGTLTGFLSDSQGNLYLLTLRAYLGEGNTPILQPSPLDGGRTENRVASTQDIPGILTDTEQGIFATDLIGLALLDPGVDISITIPEMRAVQGVHEPFPEMQVLIVGRRSNITSGRVASDGEDNTYDARLPLTTELTKVSGVMRLESTNLSAGDEGALVLDQDMYAIGMVIAVEPEPLMVPILDILEHFNAELVYLGQEIATLAGPQREIEAIAFSDDGHWLAGTSKDTDTFLWDIRMASQFNRPFVLEGHRYGVLDLAFSSDNAYLVTVGIQSDFSTNAFLWDLTKEDPFVSIPLDGAIGDLIDVAISPDNRWVAATGGNKFIYVWDLKEDSSERKFPVSVLEGHSAPINEVLFSPDGDWLASAGQDGIVRLWDSRGDAISENSIPLEGHRASVIILDFSPDGARLATAGFDSEVIVWDLTSQQSQPIIEYRFDNHVEDVTTLSFNSDGHWLASGGRDNNINLWNLNNPENSYLLTGHTDWVRNVKFTPDDSWLVSASNDTTVRLWDLKTDVLGERSIELTGHNGPVSQIAFSPDGSWLATGSDDRTVKIWQLK